MFAVFQVLGKPWHPVVSFTTSTLFHSSPERFCPNLHTHSMVETRYMVCQFNHKVSVSKWLRLRCSKVNASWNTNTFHDSITQIQFWYISIFSLLNLCSALLFYTHKIIVIKVTCGCRDGEMFQCASKAGVNLFLARVTCVPNCML